MSDDDPNIEEPLPDEAGEPAGEAELLDEAGEPADEADPADPAGTPRAAQRSGVGLRLLGAVVTLPWLVLYGITGAWAVTRAARAVADGLKQLDAGYTRIVTPAELLYVGALLLAAFGVMLACALLLLLDRRSGMVWLPLLLIAAGLTAGSVWAAVNGGLHPALWGLFFFGLAYVAVIALVYVLKVTRAERRARIVSP
jgi:hypothetical protein